ncbi:hypothetical protein [Gilliamella mensalis]|uniref:hypothetical protein n=1 Tax=Gilliamella mensalis TaxID=1908520 RepID=UPI000A164B53|nr:hypothetical protein [Gilliamella mensalis]
MTTSKVAKPIFGDKKYQIRARAALPLLVRQAKLRTPISYSDLAEELEMPNPRNLNYVLGSIGRSLEDLSKKWGNKIPPLQCIVINKQTERPGEGVGGFLTKNQDFHKLEYSKKEALIEKKIEEVFDYSDWNKVLKYFNIQPINTDFSFLIDSTTGIYGGKGESQEHKALKMYIANNPQIIGLGKNMPIGKTEYPLPSGDNLDVSFYNHNAWIAVEVKSSKSVQQDIVRGIFQCIKYASVMKAKLFVKSRIKKDVRAVLVLESKLPPDLLVLKNILRVEVIDGISPPHKHK